MACDLCANTGYIVVEVPVFADGGYSDVDRIERPCACSPEPTDADAPDWLECMNEDWTRSDPDTAQRCEANPDRCTCRAYDAAMRAHEALLDWQDVPELWAQDYPGIDFDERIPPLRPDPSDYWLPAHLLA